VNSLPDGRLIAKVGRNRDCTPVLIDRRRSSREDGWRGAATRAPISFDSWRTCCGCAIATLAHAKCSFRGKSHERALDACLAVDAIDKLADDGDTVGTTHRHSTRRPCG
ncbi:MAG: hypothetical protein WAM92_04290, partial [Mycobacterium sp.]